ncbi:hypothetical protein F5882DRAFT_62469 [Hyaloscypha sp. PMI_1271]|nr:hypothetical protein F5882DRAFT_62469 [Hyaloscypha sp. PMI_1271]
MWRNLAAAFAACRRYLHCMLAAHSPRRSLGGMERTLLRPLPPHIIAVTAAGFRIGDEDHWRFYHRPLSAIEPSTRGRLIQQPFQKRRRDDHSGYLPKPSQSSPPGDPEHKINYSQQPSPACTLAARVHSPLGPHAGRCPAATS